MADYEADTPMKRTEASLRDRVAMLEKAAREFGELLSEVQEAVKRLAREIGLD